MNVDDKLFDIVCE